MKEVPSHHDFFDPAYVKSWTEDVQRYRPERRKFFKAFVSEVKQIENENLTALELGCGPGFLAEKLLENCAILRYYLLDISPHMLDLSQKRLIGFKEKTVFIERDFKKKNWAAPLPADLDLVVSLQSVHELRHASRIPRLYKQVYDLLVPGGAFLICDHVNPRLPRHYRAAHFMTVAEHISTLTEVGFNRAKEICAAKDLSLIRAQRE